MKSLKKKALDTNLNAIKFLLKNMKKKQRIIYMNLIQAMVLVIKKIL